MAGGYRSLAGFWAGGAGAVPAVTQGGFRSLLAFWAGGAAGVTPTAGAAGGPRSLLAFWIGGAAAGAAVVPPPVVPPSPIAGGYGGGGGGISHWREDRAHMHRLQREDDEILAIILSLN